METKKIITLILGILIAVGSSSDAYAFPHEGETHAAMKPAKKNSSNKDLTTTAQTEETVGSIAGFF